MHSLLIVMTPSFFIIINLTMHAFVPCDYTYLSKHTDSQYHVKKKKKNFRGTCMHAIAWYSAWWDRVVMQVWVSTTMQTSRADTRVPADSSRRGCSALSTVRTHLPPSLRHPKSAHRGGHCTDAHSPLDPPGRGCRPKAIMRTTRVVVCIQLRKEQT